MEDSLDVLKEALNFVKLTKNQLPPLVVIDDVQMEVGKDESFTEFGGTLMSWLLEMKNLQLINILMITNEANTIYDVLVKCKRLPPRFFSP